MKRKALWVITVLLLSFLAACGNRTITIQFDAKGGSSVETMEVKQLITIEEPTTIREGYTFGGWFYEDTYETIFDFDKGASRNIKLYAKWTINQYTISFETDSDEDISPITGDYQSTLSIPNNLEKEGYTFGGWYRDEDLTESFNQTRMPAQDMTLYAKWNPIIFVVEFYIDDELHATRSVQHGEALENIPALPQRVGYNGVWSITDFSSITENLTIEAIYTKKTYTVTFEDEWGHVYHTETVEHGDKASGPSESPSKTGYTFVGYSEDLNDLIIISDQTIHVVYTPLTFIVTFRVSGNQVKSETVAYGASATPPTVSVDGYTFNGWDKAFDHITANIEVNAQLTPNVYVITVHANGGMFDDDLLEDDISAPYQSLVQYTKVPTRLGYQFAGWFLDENGTGSQIQLTNYSMPLGGMNLYAKWEVINYTIQYQNLYGTQSGNPLTYNITKAIILQSPTSRIGYDFNGWYDEASGGELVTEISLGSTGNKIFYAQWTPKDYSISYENLQGTTTSNPATYTIEDDTIELLDPSARTGYTFLGWFTQLSGGTEVSEITQGSTGNRTLYARWSAITYTITYGNLQGTSHINPASYTIQTPTILLGNPTGRTGYTFAGWYDAPEAGTRYEEIPVGSTGNLSLYARWTALTYTITYDVSGGTPISNQMVTYDQPYTLPTAVKTGYTFIGWTLEGEAFTEGTWNLLENITVVATYEANTYTITFDVAGGTPISDLTVTYDAAYTLPTAVKTGYTFLGWTLSGSPFEAGTWNLLENITIVATYEATLYTITYENLQGTTTSNPATYTIEDDTIELLDPSARTGYTFLGWFTQQSGGTEVSEITQGSTGNRTLYARWTANTYTISFNVGDGNPVSDLLVTFNQSFNLPTTTRTGYSFAGWTLNGDPFVSGTWTLTESIELVALWTEWPVITFESNGGSSIQAISQTPGSSIVEPVEPTRAGYTFDAWYNESTFDTLYVFDTMPNEDITLYAKWTALTYTITYDVSGGTPISNQMVTYD
ncbi:MAG: InlB B-repeat-containing protein, partial [Acholeplasmataceae bacterium]